MRAWPRTRAEAAAAGVAGSPRTGCDAAAMDAKPERRAHTLDPNPEAVVRTHVTVLGWLQILLGVLDLLIALAVFGVIAGFGLLAGLAGEPSLPIIGGVLGTLLGFLVVLTGLPNLLAGFGLLAHKNWARILALILAVLNLLKFPWGTALAVYTFWVLLDDETRRLFGRA